MNLEITDAVRLKVKLATANLGATIIIPDA